MRFSEILTEAQKPIYKKTKDGSILIQNPEDRFDYRVFDINDPEEKAEAEEYYNSIADKLTKSDLSASDTKKPAKKSTTAPVSKSSAKPASKTTPSKSAKKSTTAPVSNPALQPINAKAVSRDSQRTLSNRKFTPAEIENFKKQIKRLHDSKQIDATPESIANWMKKNYPVEWKRATDEEKTRLITAVAPAEAQQTTGKNAWDISLTKALKDFSSGFSAGYSGRWTASGIDRGDATTLDQVYTTLTNFQKTSKLSTSEIDILKLAIKQLESGDIDLSAVELLRSKEDINKLIKSIEFLINNQRIINKNLIYTSDVPAEMKYYEDYLNVFYKSLD